MSSAFLDRVQDLLQTQAFSPEALAERDHLLALLEQRGDLIPRELTVDVLDQRDPAALTHLERTRGR